MISYKCSPAKWLWGLIPLALPFLGAWVLNTPILVSKLGTSAEQTLKTNDFEDLSVKMTGRDAILSGHTEGQSAIDRAVKSLLTIKGVRRVDSNNIRIVKPVVLDLPTINRVSGNNNKPVISGTWPNTTANTLSVKAGKKTFVLGKDPQLSTDASGNWTLKLSDPIAEGAHDIVVSITDGKKAAAIDNTKGEVLIDTTPPAAPVAASAANATSAPLFKGTWVEKAGNKLKVVVAGKIFSLGRDKQLTSDGRGNWSLSLSQPLSEGNHAVLVETSDAAGNLARSTKPMIVSVKIPKPAQPTINKIASRIKTPTITGAWARQDESTLSVILAGKTYLLGKSSELSSDDKGNWALQLAKPLADGNYKLVTTVTNKAGKSSTVTLERAVIIDTTPPAQPTVTTIFTRNRTPVITGTWDSSDAVTLKVTVADQSYSSIKQGEIVINGDHWSLEPANPIADGTYDVVARVEDKLGNASSDGGKSELLIDGSSPATPTVRPLFGTNLRPIITGTWPQDGENTLSVTIDGKSYTPTKGGPLVSDDTGTGTGTWTLTLPEDLKPGSYDVQVKVADRLGNQSNDVSNGEVWIKSHTAQTNPAKACKKTGACKETGAGKESDRES